MTRRLRKIPGLIGPALTGLFLDTGALGDTVLDLEVLGPWIAANNLPDPAARLAGAIMLLFAGSLSILVVGYVVDSTREDKQSSSVGPLSPDGLE
jgi:hypothetical protein